MRILSTNIVRDVQAPPAKTPKAIELDLSGSRSGHGRILRSTRRPWHADVQMVARVYGRYAPRSDERDRWERIAADQDAVRERRRTRKSAKWVPLRARRL